MAPPRPDAGWGGFAVQVIGGRWFMVLASLLVMSMAGATYMFGIYSGYIKDALGYDQTTVNLLSFFKDFGGNIGIVSGLINEVTPPWVVLSMGATMNFFGYFMVWLATTRRIARPRVWQMCLYICIGSNSQSFANTGALVTCVKNFPESRGVVLGLLKGFVGLSGAIITQLYYGLYGAHDSAALILLIGWLPAAVSFAFLRTIRLMEPGLDRRDKAREVRVFYRLLYISLALAGFLMVLIILQNQIKFPRAAYVVCATVVLLLLFAPLGEVVREEWKLQKTKGSLPVETASRPIPPTSSIQLPQQEAPPSGPSEEEKKPLPSCWRTAFNPPERGEDYTILQALFSVDMLLLFTTTAFGVGGTLTAIDNLGQIGGSLGYPSTSITTFVSLVSIWNYLGRVVSGFASEALLSKYKFPRPMMLTMVLLLSCVGHLLIAFGVPNSLYVSSVIMGFCFGAQWPLLFAIISEVFGLKYYSTLYNFGAAASPVGNYVLNVRVAGGLYDKEALRQMARKAGQELNCIGVECYKMAFLIITGTTLFACAVSLLLVVRTRDFYKGDIYKKLKQQGQGQGS